LAMRNETEIATSVHPYKCTLDIAHTLRRLVRANFS
jgi:hypothetical protein